MMQSRTKRSPLARLLSFAASCTTAMAILPQLPAAAAGDSTAPESSGEVTREYEAPNTASDLISYDLYVDNNRVNEENRDDILGNGVFSYDPESNRLTINGDFESSGNSVVESSIPDLTIYTAGDSELKSNHAVMILSDSTCITGPGKFTLISGDDCAIYQAHGTLTIEDADLDASGIWGIAGYPNDESLHVINSDIHAVGTLGGVTDFSYGITLTDCKLDPEEELYLNLYVYDQGCTEDGDPIIKTCYSIDTAESSDYDDRATPANEVRIIAIKEYNLAIGGVKVSAQNKDDVLGNGVFSFDPDTNTLHIHGDYQYTKLPGTYDYYKTKLINSWIPGLTIDVSADSVLTVTKADYDLMYLCGDTTITGSGRLTLNGRSDGIVLNEDPDTDYSGCDLTITDASVEINAKTGITSSLEYFDQFLIINRSDLVINASGEAVNYISGAYNADGIMLNDCWIAVPSNAEITKKSATYYDDPDGGDGPDTPGSWYFIPDSDGITPAKKVVITDGGYLDASDVTLSQNAFAYTGSAIRCGNYITVKDGDTALKYGTDFTMKYANHVNVGYQTATVTITGIGDYFGTVTKKFSILPKKQAAPKLSVLNANGGIHVKWTADTTCEGFQIEYCRNSSFTGDTLHTVSPAAGKTSCNLSAYPKPGETWYVRIRAYIKDAGGTKRGYWSPTASIKVTGSIDNVTLSQNAFAYTGKEIKCGSYITVKAGETTLKYGTDFTMSYNNNTEVGYQTATVTINGIGNYTGTVTKKFSILPKKQAAPKLSVLSANGGIHVEWTADTTCEGFQLDYCRNSDFTGDTLHSVSLSASKTANDLAKYPKVGETWYLRIRAYIKDASGVKRGYWSPVSAIKVTGRIDSVKLSKTQFNYSGSAIKCGNYMTVKAGDTTLKYGTDFTMEYANNVECGVQTATVTIKGIGNYTGSVTKKFTIVPKQQAKPTVSSVSGGFKVTWTKDTNAAGYEVSYCKNSSFTGDTLHSATYTGTSATLTKYPATGETWYVRVRAFITKDGTKYGTYSSTVSVKAG